jgi:glycosyltransferase involved in cell wall biosynthesis
MKILWILFVWPEPGSSAAGSRTMQLIEACRDAGHEIRLSSPCQSNPHQKLLEEQGLETVRFEPNDTEFDLFLTEYNPEIVFFDRFMIEEQFGWRVKIHCPGALRVLDTVDLHFLRRLRQKKVQNREDPLLLSKRELASEDAMRELSAIYRCDLSLIISSFELNFLHDQFLVPVQMLELCRLFYPPPSNFKDFDVRNNFMMIGNFNHAPNVDAVQVLERGLWKNIQEKLKEHGIDDAELHIYGAYPSNEILKLDNPKNGFRIRGWAEDAKDVLSQYRVNLAPLRFGAGIKGKISDGWSVGTPCMATTIAAEGLHEGLVFGGIIEDDWQSFAEQAARLYSERSLWQEAQNFGKKIIENVFDEKTNAAKFIQALNRLSAEKESLREKNFVGQMLWHHQHRSTEYFSRWIEAKNR